MNEYSEDVAVLSTRVSICSNGKSSLGFTVFFVIIFRIINGDCEIRV